MYWGRMVVRGTVGAAGGIEGIQHDCQIVRKRTTFGDVKVFDPFFWRRFETMLKSRSAKVT